MDQELLAIYSRLEAEPLADEVLRREETRELVNATMSQLAPQYREALEANQNGLLMAITRSSNKSAYPLGEVLIPRSAVSTIVVSKHVIRVGVTVGNRVKCRGEDNPSDAGVACRAQNAQSAVAGGADDSVLVFDNSHMHR